MRAINSLFGRVPVKLLLDRRVTWRDKAIYAAISSFAGNKESCFPSLRAIRERCGIAEETISRSTKHLEQAGWLGKVHRGKGISNVYRVKSDLIKTINSGIDKTIKTIIKEQRKAQHTRGAEAPRVSRNTPYWEDD